MIILDTNILSEPMRTTPNPKVFEWIDAQSIESLYFTSTSLAELLVGIEVLPEGRRKSGLSAKLVNLISQLFGSRILAFDQAAAVKYAALVSLARTAGCVISVADGQIAAIAASHNFTVATRDTKPFLAAGIPVINPFEY